MGGSIAFILRENDGTEHRMCRWTNIISWAVTNMGIVNKDRSHVGDVLKQWLEMKDDYEKNKHTGKFEHDMTDVYIPHSGKLVPIDYGIIVVDMMKDVIISCQGYAAPGVFHQSAISYECLRSDDYDAASDKDSDTFRLKQFCDNNRIKKVFRRITRNKVEHYDKTDFKSVFALFRSSNFNFWHAEVDLSPFKLEKYDESDFGKVRLRLKQLGFQLTSEEEKEWDEYIKESNK